MHCTFGSGSEVAAPAGEGDEEWLEYLLRDGLREPLPLGVNQNYAETPLGGGSKAPTFLSSASAAKL